MHTITWLVQGLLAAVFLASGLAKSTMSRERLLATGQTGIRDLPMPFVRTIAISELLGACGLVLPSALGIAPILTPLAAACLGVLMIGAARIHLDLGEPNAAAGNVALLLLCSFVVFARWP